MAKNNIIIPIIILIILVIVISPSIFKFSILNNANSHNIDCSFITNVNNPASVSDYVQTNGWIAVDTNLDGNKELYGLYLMNDGSCDSLLTSSTYSNLAIQSVGGLRLIKFSNPSMSCNPQNNPKEIIYICDNKSWVSYALGHNVPTNPYLTCTSSTPVNTNPISESTSFLNIELFKIGTFSFTYLYLIIIGVVIDLLYLIFKR